MKSQRRFDIALQPSGTVSQEPGSVHVPPADGDEGKRSSVQQHTVPKTNGINRDPAKSHSGKTEEQKGENKANQHLLTYPPSSKILKRSTETCTQQQQPKSNEQQQAKRIRQQQQPSKKQDQVEKIERSQEQVRPTIIIAGDSMVRNMKGWLMSRRKSVEVQTFPGANTDEIEILLSHSSAGILNT